MIRWPKLAVLFCIVGTQTSFAQAVVNSLQYEDRRQHSIISNAEKEDEGTDVFMDWTHTLGEFNEEYVITTRDIQDQRDKLSDGKKKVVYKGIDYFLPTSINDKGIDLFMLTDEGVEIYMAFLEPVFYQETTSDIIKWIRYYAYSKRKYTMRIFQRYKQWEPYLKKTFQSNKVPPEITELCLVESACTPYALSPVGALGMWQIMPETAKGWGMVVTENLDERKDPVKSTVIAAKILQNNYLQLKDWTLAIAAYNCGTGKTGNIIKRNKSNDWQRLSCQFPKETQQYIPSLLALHYVWSYRKELGFTD